MFKLKIPPPIYMLIMVVLMWSLDHYFPVINVLSPPWNRLGIIMIFVALFADGMSLVQFLRIHTTVNPIHPEKTKILVTTGMYRFSRNPMYMGLLLVLIGWGMILGSLTPFIMLPVFIFILTIEQIIPEEHILEQKFGQQYRDYKITVNRWL